MKGCLKFFFLIFFIGAIVSVIVSNHQTAAPTFPPKPTIVVNSTPRPIMSATPAIVAPKASATPLPYPEEIYWPEKVHLTTSVVMTGANGGVTMTILPGTEVWISPNADHTTAKIQKKDPDLEATVPLNSTDFLSLCEVSRQKHITDAENNRKKIAQEINEAKAKAEAEEASYGPPPDFCDYGFGKRIPDAVMKSLKKVSKDPSSIVIRELGLCKKEELAGIKCWHIQFEIQGKNSFGGPSVAIVDAWLRGDLVLKIQVRQ